MSFADKVGIHVMEGGRIRWKGRGSGRGGWISKSEKGLKQRVAKAGHATGDAEKQTRQKLSASAHIMLSYISWGQSFSVNDVQLAPAG